MLFTLLFCLIGCDYDPVGDTSTFCLCDSEDFDMCVERRRCPLVRDADYYLNIEQSQSKIIDAMVSNENNTIFYVYSISGLKITFEETEIPNKTVSFIALDQSATIKIEYDSVENIMGTFDKMFFSDFLTLQIQNVDSKGDEKTEASVMAENVELSNSYIELDFGASMCFNNLVTDSVSLSSADNKGSIKVSGSLEITKMTNEDVENVYLTNGASMSLSGFDIFNSMVFQDNEINFHGNSLFNLHIEGSTLSELSLAKTSLQKSSIEVSGTFTGKVKMIFERFSEMEFSFEEGFDGTGISLEFNPHSTSNYKGLTFNFMNEGVVFDNISIHKSISLVLSNWKSVYSMFKHTIQNLKSATLYVDDKMEELTINENNFIITFKDSKGSSTINKETSNNIILCTGDTSEISVNINNIGENSFIINSTSENGLFNFGNIDINIENASNIIFEHGNRNITLITSSEYVPLFTISDEIEGVLFEAGTSEINISDSTNLEKSSYRTGSDLTINVKDEITKPILQSTFLSKNVIFTSDNNSSKIALYFQAPGMVTYDFSNMNTHLLSDKSSLIKTTGFILNETKLSCDENIKNQLDNIKSDLESLRNDYNFSVSKTVILEDHIITFNVSTSYINLTHDETRYNSIYIKEDTVIIIKTTSNNFEIYANENKVPQNIQVTIDSNESTRIYLDSSWYGIDIPENFVIFVSSDDLTIETNLMKLPSLNIYYPNGTVYNGSMTIKERKPKYTAKTGFILFAIFFVIILILSLVFIIFNIKPKGKKDKDKIDDEKENNKKENQPNESGPKKAEKKVHFQQQK